MTLHLFDTYARQERPFTPLAPPQVRLYACGPTVYNYQHIGNLRTYIFEDILRRALEYSGYEVHHVVNITDVGHLTSDADTGEDKMEAGARRTGQTAWEIAERYTADFQEKLEWLNVRTPHVWCRATDHIHEQIAAIAAIEEKGYVYRTDDGLYFDTSRLSDYGHLARLDIEGLQGGQRVDLGTEAPRHGLRAVEVQPSRHAAADGMGQPVGARLPRLAHRMHGHGGQVLGVVFRHSLRRRGSHLSPPYQRDCPSPSLLRHAAGRVLAPRRVFAARRGEDVQVEWRLPAPRISRRRGL